MDYYFLSKYRLTYIYIILPIIVCIVIYVVFVIYYKVEHKTTFYRAFCHTINQSKLMIVILTAIISLILIGGDLMLIAFNDNRWWFTENTRISKKIGDWGDFATCLAAFFALISILLAYKAFISQVNASKRTSFDATFTQIFAQHHTLHEKVLQHSIRISSRYRDLGIVVNRSNTIFSVCRSEYRESRLFNVEDFWENFNIDIGYEVSIDFKNYFKYIYHEINIVVSQPDEVLNEDAKRRYIQLIQAQMNYDELFCYLINQVEYLSRFERNYIGSSEMARTADEHARNLLRYRFFYELCKSYPINNLVKRVFDCVSFQVVPCNRFVRNDWFFVPGDENR